MSDFLSSLSGIIGVLRTVINTTSIDPQTKAGLHDALDQAHSAATGLVAPATTAVEALPQIAGDFAGHAAEMAVEQIPAVGGLVAPEAEALVASAVGSVVQHLEDIFARHNAHLISSLESLLAPKPTDIPA